MHYFRVNENGDTDKRWYSVYSPNIEAIATVDSLSEARKIVNYLNGGNTPKPVVRIQGETVNLDKILGYYTTGKGWLCFRVYGGLNNEGEEAHFGIKFNTIEEANNCAKWLDSLLNVVEYKPETLQNRE